MQLAEAWEKTADIHALDKRYGRHHWGNVRNEYIWEIDLKLGWLSKDGKMCRMIKRGELSYNRIRGIASFSFRGKSPVSESVFVGDSARPFTLSHYDMKIIQEMLVRAKRAERNWLAEKCGWRKESMKGITFAVQGD